jgi:hypothetical protein
MRNGVCVHCGDPIVEDDQGSWIDRSGGDGCDNGDGVHQPFDYPEPTPDTIADDLDEVLGFIREFEAESYHDNCHDNGVEESEDHIYRAADRVRHYRVMLHYAADMLDMLRKVLTAKGSKIPDVWTEGLKLLAEIDSETERCAAADAGPESEE